MARAAREDGVAAAVAEQAKRVRYPALPDAGLQELTPFAVETFGRLGHAALKLVREAAARVAAAREAAAKEEEVALVAIRQMEDQAEAEAEEAMEAELLGMAASCIQAGWRGYGLRLRLAMSLQLLNRTTR